MHIGYMTVMSFIDRWYSETCHQCTRRNNVHTDPCWSSYTVSSSCSMASCHAGVGSPSGCTPLHSGLPHSQERDSVSIWQKSVSNPVTVFRCLPNARVGTATGTPRALVTVVSYSVVPQSSGSAMSPTIWCSCGKVLLLLWEAFCLCLSVSKLWLFSMTDSQESVRPFIASISLQTGTQLLILKWTMRLLKEVLLLNKLLSCPWWWWWQWS